MQVAMPRNTLRRQTPTWRLASEWLGRQDSLTLNMYRDAVIKKVLCSFNLNKMHSLVQSPAPALLWICVHSAIKARTLISFSCTRSASLPTTHYNYKHQFLEFF